MHRLNPLKYVASAVACLAAVLLWCALTAPTLTAADTNSPPAKPVAKPKKLTGSDLYAIHCNRCHPERYPTERTEAQWKTIMLHMRVRANLPADQAKAVLKYLQEDSGK